MEAGPTLKQLRHGDHICLLYDSRDEYIAAVVSFHRKGLAAGDRCIHVADPELIEATLEALRGAGVDVHGEVERGALMVLTPEELYLRGGVFEPPDLLAFWQEAEAKAVRAGFAGLHVAGDASWVLGNWPGAERFGEYEAGMTKAIIGSQVKAICCYNRWLLPPEVLADMLRTHPQIFFGDSVLHPDLPVRHSRTGRAAEDWLVVFLQRMRQSEKALREAGGVREKLLEVVPAAIYTCDAEGRVTSFNRAAAELWGREPRLNDSEERFCGSYRLYWPDGRLLPHDKTPMAAAIREGMTSKNIEVVVERLDGSRVTVLANIAPVRDAQGEVIGAVNCLVDITERKRAEEAQARLAAIVDFADDAIISKDIEGVITSWNRGAERLFGYTAEEAIGQPVTMLMPRDRSDEETGILERVHRGESISHYETVRRRKDGTLVDISLGVSPVSDAQGRVVGASKIARDVREHKQGQEERERLLREVEAEREQLADVFERSPSFMCVVRGPDHVFERANALYYQLIGHREIAGKPAREALPELEGQGFFERLDSVYRTGEAHAGTGARVMVQRQPGRPPEERYLDFVYQAIRDADGSVTGVFVQGVDRTERRRAEEANVRLQQELRLRLQEMESILNTAPIGIGVAHDAEARVITGNPAFHRLLEVDPGDNASRTGPEADTLPFRVFTEDGMEIPNEHLPMQVAAREGTEVREVPTVVRFRGGRKRHVILTAVPLFDEEGRSRGSVAAFVDMTEQRRVALELQEANRRKDEFLAMLSHELRNPLAPIHSAVELLRLDQDDSFIRDEALGALEHQVEHLTHLVNDLLDVSRMTTGRIQLQMAEIDLNVLVQHTSDSFRQQMAERRHQFTVSLAGTPLWVRGDPTRLEQVVVNLLSNAAKYTPEGGQVWLTVQRDDSAGEAVLRVKDDGVGIEPGLLPDVFELFSQGKQALDRSQGGLGLGLALVRSLVEMHGGVVAAVSEGSGEGSEFTVRLPLVPSSPEERQPQPAGAIKMHQPGAVRVLIVDDNVDAANMMARLLGRKGHDVQAVYDGAAAVKAALESRPDVMLLDIGLPRMDGHEVARRIRLEEALSEIVLVAMTGYGQPEDVHQSREAGFDHHLVKPADMDALQRILAAVAEARG